MDGSTLDATAGGEAAVAVVDDICALSCVCAVVVAGVSVVEGGITTVLCITIGDEASIVDSIELTGLGESLTTAAAVTFGESEIGATWGESVGRLAATAAYWITGELSSPTRGKGGCRLAGPLSTDFGTTGLGASAGFDSFGSDIDNS